MREAHLRDAVALCDFFAFLEDTIGAGGKLTECQVFELASGGLNPWRRTVISLPMRHCLCTELSLPSPPCPLALPNFASLSLNPTSCVCLQVDAELTARRAAQPGFVGLSFATIAGADSNGAVIHYRPQPETCR